MSLDAEPIRLTKRGRIVIEPDGHVLVSDFEGERVTCREVCVLALGWAIQHLSSEMVKDIERPGGSELVVEATVPPEDEDEDEAADLADALNKLETALRFQRSRIEPTGDEGIEYMLALQTVRAAVARKSH